MYDSGYSFAASSYIALNDARVHLMEGEWYYTEDDGWYSYFTVKVVETEDDEIPGYPIVSMLTALTLTIYILKKKSNYF